MDLRQNSGCAVNRWFLSSFFLIFGLVALFLLLLIAGLVSYSSLADFRGVWQQEEFRFALLFTLWTSLLATGLAAGAALPCGYILARYRLPGRLLFDTLIDMPIVLPPLVSGIALLIFFGPFLGDALAAAGLRVVFTPAGVVIAQWFVALPFAIKMFKQSFQFVDPRMEKVARTLGFSPFQVFLQVTLPLAKKGILGGIMMTWARAMGEFGATAMLAGITRLKTETMSVAIFLNMSIGDIPFAISTSIVMLFMALVLLALLKTIFRSEVRV